MSCAQIWRASSKIRHALQNRCFKKLHLGVQSERGREDKRPESELKPAQPIMHALPISVSDKVDHLGWKRRKLSSLSSLEKYLSIHYIITHLYWHSWYNKTVACKCSLKSIASFRGLDILYLWVKGIKWGFCWVVWGCYQKSVYCL